MKGLSVSQATQDPGPKGTDATRNAPRAANVAPERVGPRGEAFEVCGLGQHGRVERLLRHGGLDGVLVARHEVDGEARYELGEERVERLGRLGGVERRVVPVTLLRGRVRVQRVSRGRWG